MAGSLSLAAVVEAAGARTPLHNALGGLVLVVVTQWFITLFRHLPKPVLGAIVLVGCLNLIDVAKVRRMYRVSVKDFLVLLMTIGVTLLAGIDYGVLVGVIASWGALGGRRMTATSS